MMEKHSDCPKEESGAHRLAALLRNDAPESADGERDQAEWQRLLRSVREEDARGLRPRVEDLARPCSRGLRPTPCLVAV